MNGESSGGVQLAQEQAKRGQSLSRKENLGLAMEAMSRKSLEKHVQSLMPMTRHKIKITSVPSYFRIEIRDRPL